MNLFSKISSFLKNNIFLAFLGVFVIGGVVVFFIMDTRMDENYVLEVSAEKESNKDGSEEGNKTSIFVDLSGAVNKPGVYELKNGDRIADLIALGEGVSDEASVLWVSKNLNLSKKLEDSAKIYIPFEWEFYLPEKYQISKTVNTKYAGASDSSSGGSNEDSSGNYNDPSSSSADQTDISDGGNGDTSDPGGVVDDGKLNVNTASSSELDTLPGIGPAYAEKIISNRPYVNLTDFEARSGLYKSTIENIKNLIVF